MSLRDLTPDQRELAQLISRISERHYFAEWMSEIEVQVWRALNAPQSREFALRLTESEVARLRELSVRCEGWIVFDDLQEEKFVDMADWLARLPSDQA